MKTNKTQIPVPSIFQSSAQGEQARHGSESMHSSIFILLFIFNVFTFISY